MTERNALKEKNRKRRQSGKNSTKKAKIKNVQKKKIEILQSVNNKIE